MPLLEGTFNIRATNGTAGPLGHYLSVGSDRADLSVKLSDLDDGSGRQRWTVESIPVGGSFVYRMYVEDGRPVASCTTLSCSPGGPDDGEVELGCNDDGSGRQRWWLIPLGNDCYHICVVGGRDGKCLLSRGWPGHSYVDLWWRVEDDNNQVTVNPHSWLLYSTCMCNLCVVEA